MNIVMARTCIMTTWNSQEEVLPCVNGICGSHKSMLRLKTNAFNNCLYIYYPHGFIRIQSKLDRLKLWGLFLQAQITRSANIFALRMIRTCKNSPHIHNMSIEINKNVILEFRNSSYWNSNDQVSTVTNLSAHKIRKNTHGKSILWLLCGRRTLFCMSEGFIKMTIDLPRYTFSDDFLAEL